MSTLTPGQLGELLRQDAAGEYATEAATELLCQHGRWLTRSDFRATCIGYDDDGTERVAWIQWSAVAGFLAEAPCSSSEVRILRLAAELAGHDSGVPLSELLTGLDERNSRIVVVAIAHAVRMDGRR